MQKGRSRARDQGRFLPTPETQKDVGQGIPDEVVEAHETQADEMKIRRHASVYDAVAGRIGLNGFLKDADAPGQSAVPVGTPKALTPDEVLLRRTRAPTDVPLDFYKAEVRLGPSQRLPDSDLLKALHQYASDFFSMATYDKGKCDVRSLDETALLAMGILLEEAAVEALGENGDMVLVEPDHLQNGLEEDRITKHQVSGRVKPVATPELEAEGEDEEEQTVPAEDSGEEKRRKRRRYFR